MDRRGRRIGENEVLYREVNAQMRSLDERLATTVGEEYPFLCECGDIDCTERLSLSVADYERIHAHPARFAIVAGHEKPDVETVVERHDGWFVIEKDEGGPAEYAAEHRPERQG